MPGVTDWHGWSYMSDDRTIFQGDNSENIEKQIAKKASVTDDFLYRQGPVEIRFNVYF
jgi:hypothetical protein